MSFALFAGREETDASRGKWWGRAFFFSLALGGLAKGPVALVLVGLAAGAWNAASGRWRLVRRLPWITGLSILIVVACPWYIAAERATPGFLHYFLLNEHLLRYIRAEYGDLYGAGGRSLTGPVGSCSPSRFCRGRRCSSATALNAGGIARAGQRRRATRGSCSPSFGD